MNKQFTYSRIEKLKSRKRLAQLFAHKQSLLVFPVKVFYLLLPTEAGESNAIQVGVGVNSRNFKKAVHRNRVKRLLRETYRLNKLPLHDAVSKGSLSVIVFFLYIDKTLPAFDLLQHKMPLAIRQLIKRLDENIAQNT